MLHVRVLYVVVVVVAVAAVICIYLWREMPEVPRQKCDFDAIKRAVQLSLAGLLHKFELMKRGTQSPLARSKAVLCMCREGRWA